MKRHMIDIVEVAKYDNLALAAHKAARGKRNRKEVQIFFEQFDRNLNQLGEAVIKEKVPVGKLRAFRIFDPKERVIHAACFKDRVLHHALMNLAGPILEQSMMASSFACRPGKGIHKAIQYVQTQIRKYPWYLKLDISHYFDAIDHAILMRLLAGRFKGSDFLKMVQNIIHCYETDKGKGLPIGSLTSQNFANYYLNGLDRYVMETLETSAHVRYMDDVVIWCMDKPSAKKMLGHIIDYSREKRGLQVKPSSIQINRSSHGISFCGFRVLPGAILLGCRRRKRYIGLRKKWENYYQRGWIDSLQLQKGYAAVHAITLGADSLSWRKKCLSISPPLDM